MTELITFQISVTPLSRHVRSVPAAESGSDLDPAITADKSQGKYLPGQTVVNSIDISRDPLILAHSSLELALDDIALIRDLDRE